jgi:hypothetical protein
VKKVALLLTGLVRDYQYGKNICQFIDRHEDFDIDVFTYVWDVIGNTGSPWREHMTNGSQTVSVTGLKEKFRVSDGRAEVLREFYEKIPKGEPYETMRNVRPEYYCLYKGFSTFEEQLNKYDLIMRGRFDVSYDKINLSELDFSRDIIYTPDNLIVGYGIKNGVAAYYHAGKASVEIEQGSQFDSFILENEVNLMIDNRIAISNFNNMKIYCSVYDAMEEMRLNDGFWKSLNKTSVGKKANTSHESILAYHLNKNGTKFEPNKALNCEILGRNR